MRKIVVSLLAFAALAVAVWLISHRGFGKNAGEGESSKEGSVLAQVGDEGASGTSASEGEDLLSKLDGLDAAGFKAMAETLAAQGTGFLSAEQTALFFEKWAAVDPVAAFTESLGDSALVAEYLNREAASLGVLQEWASQPGTGIAENVAAISSASPDRIEKAATIWGQMLEASIDGMLSSSQEEAVGWVESLEHSGLRNRALSVLAERLAEASPEEAARWAEAKGQGNPAAEEAFEIVADAYAKKTPEEALSWAMGLENERSRDRALMQAIKTWGAQDLNGIAEAFNDLPASEEIDPAFHRLSSLILDHDPESAATWSASITNAELRKTSMIESLNGWARKDRAAAEKWLAESDFDAEEKQTLHRHSLLSWEGKISSGDAPPQADPSFRGSAPVDSVTRPEE